MFNDTQSIDRLENKTDNDHTAPDKSLLCPVE